MSGSRRNYVFLGLSITSAWGNGHATTYRGLLKELAARGHSVTFLERDVPWYASNRELSELPYCQVSLYRSLQELSERFSGLIREADAVVVGSYVPEGIAVGRWVNSAARGLKIFYDIDTPVTLASLRAGKCEYLSCDLIGKYDLYLSFTGGPILSFIEDKMGSPCARPLYCSVDPAIYYPEKQPIEWDLAYLGTYAADRQSALGSLLIAVAGQLPNRKFVVAGPQYPNAIEWPGNLTRIEHLPAAEHRKFYNSQAFALNLTRRDMIRAGYSPSVRLFEAAACGVPIITDQWPGLADFFKPHLEILPVRDTAEVLACLKLPAQDRLAIAERARRRTLRFHTAAVRAAEFDSYVDASISRVDRSNKWRATGCQSSGPALLEK
ncbi:MAG: glycosyltransferase [Acidobacteriota bacterium]|nr:glycosyltransferase [Acidobacteriota bacterium]